MEKSNKWSILRHRAVYKGGRLVAPFIMKKYNFKTDKLPKTKENYIVLANHLTEVDMLMVGMAFPRHMYFVAGEHLTRSKHGKMIQWSQDPIFRPKGSSSLASVKEIMRRVRAGHNVMIFPEGNRSFGGETEVLPEAIAKLVKRCNCGLVTYHIEGGYFVAPRWAHTFRVGPMKGNIVKYRTAAEVAALSVPALTEIINRELYEHAYETQRKNRYAYKGERLAEGLENYLVHCCRCGSLDSLHSKGDEFSCAVCGLKGRYGEDGFLHGEDLKFDTVYDWGKWSEAQTEAYVRTVEPEQVAFRDTEVTLYEVTADHRRTDLYTGDMEGFRDRYQVGEFTFKFEDFSAISMLYYGRTLLFTCGKRYFGITGEHFHAIKYYKLYEQKDVTAHDQAAVERTAQ